MNSIIGPYEEAAFESMFTTAPASNSPYPAADSNGLGSYTPPQDTLGDSTFIPVQSTYSSLFQPSAERPRFSASYLWWEDEATTVLWAFDAQEIQRVIRYGLFPDENLPRTALQSRNESTVDNFLATLVKPQERPFIANLSHVQKVEEILRRSKGTSPALASWSWFPSQLSCDQDSRAIAASIGAESRLHFIRIPFEEWVRYSLGYEAGSVEWFLQQHTAFHIHLLNYLNAFPEEIEKYTEVEKLADPPVKHLQNKSPFAHRALVRCLHTVQGIEHDSSLSPVPGFDFIASPIQRLFKEHPPSLTAILKVLCVLDVRFQQTYVHIPEMDWNKCFDTSVTFLEDMLASTSAMDMVHSLTATDEGYFSELNPQSIMTESPVLRQLTTEWHSLSVAVWEVSSALPDSISYIEECVQALFLVQNYHSLTAMLNGLQKYNILSFSVSNVNTLPASLLDPFQNYLTYRQQFHNGPGIPFLLPHIREFKRRGKGVLHQLFQQIQIHLP